MSKFEVGDRVVPAWNTLATGTVRAITGDGACKIAFDTDRGGISDVDWFDHNLLSAPTPAASTPVVGSSVRLLKDDPRGCGAYKAGDKVVIVDGTLVFYDSRGDRRTVALSEVVLLSAEDIEREATIETLRATYMPTDALFKAGTPVIIADDSITTKTGLVLSGPDREGDYLVAVSLEGYSDTHYYQEACLKAA